MHLTDKKLYEYKRRLEQGLFGNQVILNSNGTFYIYNVKESDVNNIKNRLENSKIVSNVYASSSRYDFNSSDSLMRVGMKMLPKSLYTIRGILKDDIDEAVLNQKYRYQGPAFKYEHFLGDWDLYTVASSTSQALQNIRSQIAKKSGWPVPFVKVFPNYLHLIEEPDEEQELAVNSKYCEICGRQLTDAGECPSCDLGEEDLYESIEIHDTLNPKLWNEDEELIPEVKDKIKEIVDEFVTQLNEDEIPIKVDDIVIVGSNANYNYTDNSDLDIHIIADETDDCAKKHMHLIYDISRRLFNQKYDISIKGINVEIYVENKDAKTSHSAGIYSLKNGWISKPADYEISDYSESNVDSYVAKWQEEAEDILADPSIESIDNFMDKIYDARINDVDKNGEFGELNLAFKEIRRLGYLDQLRDLRNDLISKELSLESLEEDTEKVKDGKWVNRGKEGTHGTFKTKKAADAQRKAMFANGFHEELEERPNKTSQYYVTFYDKNRMEESIEFTDTGISSTVDKNHVQNGKKSLSDFKQVKATEDMADHIMQFVHLSDEVEVTFKDEDTIIFEDDNGDVVAIVSANKPELDNKYMGRRWLTYIEVAPEYRGYGLSDQLLEFAIKNMHVNTLGVAKTNEIAMRLYKKHGFEIWKENPNDKNYYWMYLKGTMPETKNN